MLPARKLPRKWANPMQGVTIRDALQRRKPTLAVEALEWLASDAEYVCSAVWCCQALGMDLERIRARVAAQRKRRHRVTVEVAPLEAVAEAEAS